MSEKRQQAEVMVPGGVFGVQKLKLESNNIPLVDETDESIRNLAIPSSICGIANDATIWVSAASIATTACKVAFLTTGFSLPLLLVVLFTSVPVIAVPTMLLASRDGRLKGAGIYRYLLIIVGSVIAL